MHLCSYTVRIEIPDDWSTRTQDNALDVIDAFQLEEIRRHTENTLQRMVSTRGATVEITK